MTFKKWPPKKDIFLPILNLKPESEKNYFSYVFILLCKKATEALCELAKELPATCCAAYPIVVFLYFLDLPSQMTAKIEHNIQ